MKLYVLLLSSTLLLFGCTEGTVTEEPIAEDTSVSNDVELGTEKPSEEVEKAELEEVVTEPETTIIKKEQIEGMFIRDPDEEVYENATFITKSDGQLTADYIIYVGDDTIPYVSAIYYGGDLADISFETELSNEELEKTLGATFSEETRKGIIRKNSTVNINFDKRFAEENIERFPFELD